MFGQMMDLQLLISDQIEFAALPRPHTDFD
jgi:hypothetical protein